MSMLPIAQIKLGDCLSKDVSSELGGIIMPKGRVLTERDIEVLDAFMIKHVYVNSKKRIESAKPAPAKTPVSKDQQTKPAEQLLEMDTAELDTKTPSIDQPFHLAWTELAKLMSQVLNMARANQVPTMEMRKLLRPLMEQIKEYKPLAVQIYIKEIDQDLSTNFLIHKSIAVALTTYLIGHWNGCSEKEGMQIALAGLLHDIGKVKVDEDVLRKKESLTEVEQTEVRRHTLYGYEILRSANMITEGVKLAALQHHERLDGSGYPLRIMSDQIHPYAKMVAIADMFHAMTQNRSYRKAASPYVVLEQLHRQAFGKLDPQMVQVFIQKLTLLTQGTIVQLNDGRTGEIVFIDSIYPTRPWVSVEGTIIRLAEERQLHIEKVISE
ncbi:HD-GYP domain-containing protein [Paenibacillus sp. SC116]|uniref:HD-GYP domain-containing protein n=1 Tax=Paenibacillus sp. SC116 TaxID=2968986 RepID=UPI00215B5EA9|nr:HD-GYP domain-containing protein [Paenibacillus sp. SC116]MCR8844378.1 HD-GYP domain-containing protein [Paenibacillus sp. SC116]